jgi:hypothetical protein
MVANLLGKRYSVTADKLSKSLFCGMRLDWLVEDKNQREN